MTFRTLSRTRLMPAWLRDGALMVQIALVVLALAMAGVFSTPVCTTCLPTYRGLVVYGGDVFWARVCLVVGVAGVPALIARLAWLRAVTLLVHSICCGFFVHLLSEAPAPVIGLAAFSVFMVMSWWAIYMLSLGATFSGVAKSSWDAPSSIGESPTSGS